MPVPVTEPSEIAFFVRETRQVLGLTQEQFARKLGVSYQSVNRAREWADSASAAGSEAD